MRGSGSLHWQGRVRRSPSGVTHSARPPISSAAMGQRRFNSGWRAQERVAICASPSSGSSEQVLLAIPAAVFRQARRRAQAARACCLARSAVMSPARLVQATSGCRRIVPVEAQGASINTASNGPAS